LNPPTRATAEHAALKQINRLSLRLLFAVGAASAACGAIVYAASALRADDSAFWASAGACAALMLLLLFAAWRSPTVNLRLAVGGAAISALVVLGVLAVVLGEGIHTPALAYAGLLLCGVAAVGGPRMGWGLTVATLALVLGLYLAELHGLITGAAYRPDISILLRLFTVLGWLAAGLGAGLVLHHAVQQVLLDARRREQRFRAMLRIAVDWYWEQDASYRYTYVSEKTGQGSLLALAHRVGEAPWDIVEFGLTAEQMEAHRAQLEARKPFVRLIAKRRDESGQAHFVSLSGEPHFDERRVFQGYRGIGRDVTSEVSAQMAVAASEARYRELFARSPTPLVLHRRGLVLEANAAAAHMFGFDTPREMLGFNLLEVDEEAASQAPPIQSGVGSQPGSTARVSKVLARVAALDAGAPGDSIPVTDFCMRSRRGQRILAQVTATRVETPQGAATLSLYFDNTARQQMTSALAAARDAAEAASRAKTAFLANTSHEVRTPLHGLLGLARLAQAPDLDEVRRQRYLEQILDSAEGLAHIITDVLDLSKIEAGKLSLDTTVFSLYDELVNVQRSYEPLADAKGLRFELRIASNVPTTVSGDPVRVRQILSNYINNALKFTQEGWVQLDARMTDAGLVQLTVTDTGPGIDPGTQARLFSPFTQADESTTRRYGGTGLGLSICRELASLMQGRVGVTSRLGEGSSFWAELSLPPAQSAPQVVDISLDDTESLRGARVLLVEDNPVNMMIGVALLEQWGVEVSQAEDGHLAVQAVHDAFAQGHGPDVVLMDVQMPSMSGHEAARQLRQRYSAQMLPIIALTAAALVSEREDALGAGMNDFLTKPIDNQRLQQTLVRVLKARRSKNSDGQSVAQEFGGEVEESTVAGSS
jgi:PAS domain S-box-containing protein